MNINFIRIPYSKFSNMEVKFIHLKIERNYGGKPCMITYMEYYRIKINMI